MDIFFPGILLLAACVLAAGMRAIGPIGAIGLALPFEATSLLGVSGTSLNVTDAYIVLLMLAAVLGRLLARRPLAFRATNLTIVFGIVAHAVLVTLLMPSLFAGTTQVADVAGSAAGQRVGRGFGLTVVPLEPTRSNLSQLGYLVLQMGTYVFLVLQARRRGAAVFARLLGLAVGVNLLLVSLDLAGFKGVLDWFFTADYRNLQGAHVLGMDRLVGGFREAARQGQFSAAMFAFWFATALSRGGTGAYVLAGVSLLAAVLSLSSTAFVSVAAAVLFITLYTLTHAGARGHSKLVRRGLMLASAFCIALIVLVLAAPALAPDAPLAKITSALLVEKGQSSSGLERLALLKIGLDVARDTWLLGAGLGSTRANGLLMLWLANLGLVGLVLILAFIWTAFRPRRCAGLAALPRPADPFPAWAALTVILTASLISLTFPNLGQVFMILMAASVSAAEARSATRAPLLRRAAPGEGTALPSRGGFSSQPGE